MVKSRSLRGQAAPQALVAVAEELAQHGAFVVISDLPAVEARLEGALANLRSRYPNVAMCVMDVSDADPSMPRLLQSLPIMGR